MAVCSGPPRPSCLSCSRVPCYPHPPMPAHPWVLREGSGSPGCWGGTAHTGCCAVAWGPACHGTGGSVLWDLLPCPVGAVGWPQAQPSMAAAAEAVLSCAGVLGMAWAWCLLQQRDTASPAQAVAHMYITCTPTHTDMQHYRHTCCASTHVLTLKRSLTSTHTLAH